MRLLFYDRRSPWFNSWQIIVLFALLFFASAQTTQTVESTTDKESGTTTVLTSAATSAATSAKSVETTEAPVITTTNVPTTTVEEIDCTSLGNITTEDIVFHCSNLPVIGMIKSWFDISNIDERTANTFLSNLTQIWFGGIRLVANDKIETIDIGSMTGLGDREIGGLKIEDTRLKTIKFIENNGKKPGLILFGSITVRGNRYLGQETLDKINFIGAKNKLNVQKLGECVVHMNNIDLKHCTRVYKDLHLKEINLQEVAPDFQPEAISGCLKIEESVTLHKSTFDKLLENPAAHKENNCDGDSYVKPCIKRNLHDQLKEAFKGTFQTYSTESCQFTCVWDDIVIDGQLQCTVIEGNVIINAQTNMDNIINKKLFETVKIVRGQILIDGTNLTTIDFLDKQITIESGAETALIVTNNMLLHEIKYKGVTNITSSAGKWVKFENNGEYKVPTDFFNQMRIVIRNTCGKNCDYMEKLDIDKRYKTQEELDEEKKKPEEAANPDNSPKADEKPQVGQSNQAKQGNKKKDEGGDNEEEDNTTKNGLIIAGVVCGIVLLILVAIGVVIFYMRRNKKKKIEEEEKRKKEEKAKKLEEEREMEEKRLELIEQEQRIEQELLQKKEEERRKLVEANEFRMNGKPELGSGKSLEVKTAAVIPKTTSKHDKFSVGDKELAHDTTIADRVFNFAESSINTPVLVLRFFIMFGFFAVAAKFVEKCRIMFGLYFDEELTNSMHKVLTYQKAGTSGPTAAPPDPRHVKQLKIDTREFKKDYSPKQIEEEQMDYMEHVLRFTISSSNDYKSIEFCCGIGVENFAHWIKDMKEIRNFKKISKEEFAKHAATEKRIHTSLDKLYLPHPGEEFIEISYYKYECGNGRFRYMEFHNYPAGDEDDWMLGNIAPFYENVNLARFVLWAYENKYHFVAPNPHLTFLVQLFMVAFFFIFEYKNVATVNLNHCVHLSIIACAKKLTYGLDDHGYYFPPDTVHAYIIQMQKFLMPFIEEMQLKDRHYLGIQFNDFTKSLEAYNAKNKDTELNKENPDRAHRKDDKEMDKPRMPEKIQKRNAAGKDKEKDKKDKANKDNKDKDNKDNKDKDNKDKGKDKDNKDNKGKKDDKDKKDNKDKDNKGKKDDKDKKDNKDKDNKDKDNKGKNDQAAGEKSKAGKDSDVNSQVKSDINVQPKSVGENSQKNVSCVSKVGEATKYEVLSSEANKQLVYKYIAETLTMNNIVKKHLENGDKYIFWQYVWASQAEYVYHINDLVETLKERVKVLKNDPESATQKSI